MRKNIEWIIYAKNWILLIFEYQESIAAEKFLARYISLPFKWGNNGGWNCVPSDAKCVGKNRGGVARGALLSSNGRKPFVLQGRKKNNYSMRNNPKNPSIQI